MGNFSTYRDKSAIGWSILAFLLPLGLIAYFVFFHYSLDGETILFMDIAGIIGTVLLALNILTVYMLLSKDRMTEQMEIRKAKVIRSLKQLGHGILTLAAGGGISLVSFAINSKSYYVAIGAITAGAIYLLTGTVKFIIATVPSLALFFRENRHKAGTARLAALLAVLIPCAVPVINRQSVSIEPEMVFVQGGTFIMGCTDEQEKAHRWNAPAHQVSVGSFSICKYEVTQGQWEAVMEISIEEQIKKARGLIRGKGKNFPVYYVNWDEVQEFIRRLNVATGRNYRLPTEAEWEYAARGGVKSQGYKYSGSNNEEDVAWSSSSTKDGFGSRAHPVGKKQPNELGIYDMSGNVAEWCSDWYS
ncbi:MAG: formylglycine-generating enzyme family protein, partial [Prevotellaceae bacterium]|nr:formylglycine-generating enzyme family protein [Prevotellaceae bacterium]